VAIISSKEAADRLGLSVRRVQALIKSGKLPGQKFGTAYMINEKDLALVKDRKPGRPKKLTSKRKPK
jgi:excisionase family DNA binding protein